MITINGIPVLSLVLEKPARRAWWAAVDVDVASAAPAEGATVELGGLRGAVVRRQVDDTRIGLVVVGGTGGLGRTLPARHYGPCDRLTAARDALREVGESLAAASTLSSLANALSRPAITAGSWLDLLSTQWRVLDDGTVFVGAEPVSATTVEVLESDRELGIHRYLVDDLTLNPNRLVRGGVLDGHTISRVRVIATADRLTGHVWA